MESRAESARPITSPGCRARTRMRAQRTSSARQELPKAPGRQARSDRCLAPRSVSVRRAPSGDLQTFSVSPARSRRGSARNACATDSESHLEEFLPVSRIKWEAPNANFGETSGKHGVLSMNEFQAIRHEACASLHSHSQLGGVFYGAESKSERPMSLWLGQDVQGLLRQERSLGEPFCLFPFLPGRVSRRVELTASASPWR